MEHGRNKHWDVKNPEKGLIEEISRKHGVTKLTSRVLINRGIVDDGRIEEFLRPSLSHLSDPMEMEDVEKAAKRVISACINDEKILIYADYDVDGATGGALLYLFLKEVFPDAKLIIHQNDRISDGYGIKAEYVEIAGRRDVGLIVTVDCGISNFAEIEVARELGIDVIVTDHHTVKNGIPPAFAVLNPKREDCRYRFKDLAGVGVVFVLVCALRKILREMGFFDGKDEPNLLKYLDLVALGTVADIVPLVGDNRVFVKFGLEQLKKNPRPGMKALMDATGVRREFLTEVDLGFRIGPRINAAGRIGDSSLSSAILIEDSYTRAIDMAKLLSRQNSRRQLEEEKILKEVEERIKVEGLDGKRLIVVGAEGWHVGVIGIVASRIMDRYGLPTLIFSFDGEVAKGSARSMSGVNILEIISSCSHLLEKFGGHSQAAGLVVRKEVFDEFEVKIQEAASKLVTRKDLVRSIEIDGEIPLPDLSERFFEELSFLAPFGLGNPEPVFLTRNLDVFGVSRRKNFLSFNVSQGNASFEVICFGEYLDNGVPSKVDLVFSPRSGKAGAGIRGKLFARDMKFI